MSELFRSFLLGGFEGSTMTFPDGRRVDPVAVTGHERRAEADYALLRQLGIATVREALRWHAIERTDGGCDWAGFRTLLAAARRAGVQVIWDLCHFGWPDGLDIWSPAFVDRFAAFAREAAEVHAAATDEPPLWCPVNEISYWSWAAGEEAHFLPATLGRGTALKHQLVRAAIAAADAVRTVDRRARLVFAEPAIHIVGSGPDDRDDAERHRRSMFEAWDMVAGRLAPELGGRPELLDIVGVNFYDRNEWVHYGRTLHPGEPLYRPFAAILAELWARYRRPLFVAETGAEGEAGPPWLDYVAAEVAAARAAGVPVAGVCLYPAMDYPGWEDGRHCRCGPIRIDPGSGERRIDGAMAAAIRRNAPRA